MQTGQADMEEADASNVAEAERRYLLSLLTMAEELLSLLPETVKKKYGIIKGTLAVRLGSKISNLPKTSVIFTSLSQGIQPHLPSKEHSSITTPRDSKQLDQDQVDRKLTEWNQSNEAKNLGTLQRRDANSENSQEVNEGKLGTYTFELSGGATSQHNALESALLKRHLKSLVCMHKRIQGSRSSENKISKSENFEVEFQNVAEGITSCCEEFARLEVLLEQELQLESNPDVHGNDDLSNPNASNSGTDSRKSKTGSQPGREMRQMEINEIVKERDEARMEIDRLAQELHKSNGLLENAILRALQAEQMKTNYDKWIKETEDQYQATIEMHEHELRSYYEEVMETKLKQAEAEKRECLRNLRSELECKHAKALASAQASYAEKLQAADERIHEANDKLKSMTEERDLLQEEYPRTLHVKIEELEAENQRLRRSLTTLSRRLNAARDSSGGFQEGAQGFEDMLSSVLYGSESARQKLRQQISNVRSFDAQVRSKRAARGSSTKSKSAGGVKAGPRKDVDEDDSESTSDGDISSLVARINHC